MNNKVYKRLQEAFELTKDLCVSIKNTQLEQKIPKVKSNKIGEQFWCIIGARESFIKALENSEWKGFSCSIKNSFSETELLEKLQDSSEKLSTFYKNQPSLDKKQEDLLLDLFTHEIQHHGQLIRFFYALEIPFPKSWNKKYTV